MCSSSQLAGVTSGLLNGGQYFGSGLSALLTGWAVDLTGSWSVFPAAVSLGPLLTLAATVWLMWLQRHVLRPKQGSCRLKVSCEGNTGRAHARQGAKKAWAWEAAAA